MHIERRSGHHELQATEASAAFADPYEPSADCGDLNSVTPVVTGPEAPIPRRLSAGSCRTAAMITRQAADSPLLAEISAERTSKPYGPMGDVSYRARTDAQRLQLFVVFS